MSIQSLELVTLIRIVILSLREKKHWIYQIIQYVISMTYQSHTWRTIESHNEEFYIISKMMYLAGGGTATTEEYDYNP